LTRKHSLTKLTRNHTLTHLAVDHDTYLHVKLDMALQQMPWGAQTAFRDLYGNSFVVTGPLHAKPQL
jgi:hypothetical protein